MPDDDPQKSHRTAPPDGMLRSHRRVAYSVLGLLAVLIAGIALYAWRFHHPTDRLDSAEQAEETGHRAPGLPALSQVVNPGYVGPEVCAECHAERVAEFKQTNHYRTCRVAVPPEMPASFTPDRGTFHTRYPGLKFEMEREGERYFQTTVLTVSDAERRFLAPINFVYGAGTADDVYLSWRDDNRMYELPVSWLHPTGQWGIAHIDPDSAEPDYSRPLSTRCLECHNTWFAHVPGTANEYQHDGYVRGVTCERCHGPGRRHVEFHRTHPASDSPNNIVQPARLTRQRQIEVCTQCHGQALKHRGPAFSYRPGEPLDAYYRSVTTRHNEDDHVANQIRYLRQSACFQNSETMTCVTCHDPHRRREQPDSGAHSCRQCHTPEDCGDREHLPEGVQSRCVACHMPRYVKINVNFQTEDDDYVPPVERYEHRIAVYPAARKEVLRDWCLMQADAPSKSEADRLSRELVAYWLAEADKRRGEYRFLAAIAAIREAMRFDTSPALREKLREAVATRTRLYDQWREGLQQMQRHQQQAAIDTFEAILDEKPDDARAHGRLGALFAMTGRRELAEEHLLAVVQYDPADAYGETMLGWLAYLDGRSDEALLHFKRADEIEPYNAKIHWQTGLARLQSGRVQEAVDAFRQALEINPRHVDSCLALSQALRVQGEPDGALPFAQRAVELSDHANVDLLLNLAETYAASGDFDSAEAEAMEALDLAERQSPARVPDLRVLLHSYRTHRSSRVTGQFDPNLRQQEIEH